MANEFDENYIEDPRLLRSLSLSLFLLIKILILVKSFFA